jgi:hypothetical protein
MARYYASRSGRFITPDPGHVGANVNDPQTWNAYVYVGNDPINWVDPDGLKKECPKKTKEDDPPIICVDVEGEDPGTGSGGGGGGGFDFGWWPSFDNWTKTFSKYWDAFSTREAMDHLKQRFLGGIGNFFDDHRRMTHGLSPVPTTPEEATLQLAMSPLAKVSQVKTLYRAVSVGEADDIVAVAKLDGTVHG